VRNLTSSAGAITDTYEYDAFGNKNNSTGSTPDQYLYRGEYFDSDLGLYYLRARYYNPLTGRFMARDPEDGDYTNPTTLHKYLYAAGDPVNLSDPTGRTAQAATWGGGAGEYAGLTSIISLGAQVGEVAVAVAVSCVLEIRPLRC
jgi:RHS repeat-associated protein